MKRELKVIAFDRLDSTNRWARENYAHFDKEQLTVVTAKTQERGEGRYRRVWCDQPGTALLATFCFSGVESYRNHYTQLMALIAAKCIANLTSPPGKTPLNPQLKWPNDLMIGGKKIGGVLAEVKECSGAPYLIVGIGLNLNTSSDFLSSIDQPATSLLIERGGEGVEVGVFLEQLCDDFSRALSLFEDEKSFAGFLLDYSKWPTFSVQKQ